MLLSTIKRPTGATSNFYFIQQSHLVLFTLGINNGLRGGDILNLKVKEIKNLKPGETLTIREKKTGKPHILMVNKSVHRVLKSSLDPASLQDDDYLFKSRKGKNTPPFGG